MVVPVSLQPTFSSGSATRLFDAPVQPWYVNRHRTPAGGSGRPAFDSRK
jgi:hypothetical protein